LIDTKQYYHLSRKFEKILKEDKHNKGDGYLVRSLYFDTLDDADFMEKIDGTDVRKKIRLRNYGPNSDFAQLEMKQKQGELQKKRAVSINKHDATLLTRGAYSPLLNYHSKFAMECFSLMNMQFYRPKCVVTYKRKAFVTHENEIRITFDQNIQATESNFNIFDSKLIENNVFDPDLVVMEVKFNGFLLSYIKDIINEINSTEIAISKYCMGRTIDKNYLFL